MQENRKLNDILLEELGKSCKDFFAIGSGDQFMNRSFEFVRSLKKKRVALVSDQNIWKGNGNYFVNHQSLFDLIILDNPRARQDFVDSLSKKISGYNLVIAFGSGTINDLCKLAAFNNKIPYLVFASAASMNGYLSPNASVTINGHKKTILAQAPIFVFCNIDIILAAPIELVKAGIGDAMCFYSCWFDWYLSHLVLSSEFRGDAFVMLEDQMSYLVKNYKKFEVGDPDFVGLLCEILLVSGLSMMICSGSYPASQSEHLIAHAIDMKYPNLNNLHGSMIASCVIDSARIQKELLDNFDEKIALIFNRKDDLKKVAHDIDNFFGDPVITQQVMREYKAKLDLVKNRDLDLGKIKELLGLVYFGADQLLAIFNHFEIEVGYNSLGISHEECLSCIDHAKFIRNRFTCLDLVK